MRVFVLYKNVLEFEMVEYVRNGEYFMCDIDTYVYASKN